MINFWNSLSRSAKNGLMGGIFIIVLATAGAGFWLLRADYQVLFADMKPQDSAVMVAELDRLKIPYKIADSGTAILVEREIVHATRLKLLGKALPLNGVVGLELFNNSDFGMTEFSQKINYQRALQGEITRTIASLDEVLEVRVHLALPEEGLFKRATSKAKAAITIALKPGHSLRTEQTLGIQRLVAAAVPGILAQDVTIVDKQGIALTRTAGQTENDFISSGLELKKDTENLLSKKVNDVLTKTFGENQASASVDVILNMDQIKVTTEDVLSTPNESGQATGVIVKDKESIRDIAAPLDAGTNGLSTKSGNSQREIEYQVGRRVEQIVSQPGAIKRISAVAVIHKNLTEEQKEQVRALVAAAIGANLARGDYVVVQSLLQFDGQEEKAVTEEFFAPITKTESAEKADKTKEILSPASSQILFVSVFIAFILLALILVFVLRRKPSSQALPVRMSEQERVQALKNIQDWMNASRVSDEAAPDLRVHSQEWGPQ